MRRGRVAVRDRPAERSARVVAVRVGAAGETVAVAVSALPARFAWIATAPLQQPLRGGEWERLVGDDGAAQDRDAGSVW